MIANLVKAAALGLTLAVSTLSPAAWAREFPAKPVTIIVPYSAGGGADSFARALQRPLESALGTDVVVRNVAGGGGAVGYMQALAARPDGYTVTVPLNAIFTLVGMGNVTFKVDDFDYIARITEEPYVLTVTRSDRWSDLQSFIAASQEKPVTLGVAGVGSSGHIMTIAMAQDLGLKANFIPYGGNADAAAAALGGHIDGVVLQPSDAAAAIEGEGGLIPLAATAPSALLKDVPLFKDLGVDLTTAQWRGIATPKGVDPAILARWEDALKTAVKDPEFRQTMTNLGFDLNPIYGADLQAFVQQAQDLFLPLTEAVATQ
ncbi:tripartite tricarboxylate transporter substrate binding protein [Pseudooceanicola sp. CBS1P-1]|uniref:Tripartite tricarboxylate transporter substrate binding protein n=1 Tax=Pseudooceanicola albus TaxID=2692189 RepID=A0A6L7G4V4_9RHOB|nr:MULTISPECIES: tripartite tricarboxylate transporter substrate binding protein [Pseudooceanicola]MBT9385272.1 tripartite tricarboxylate transporter substrate binding protein [Pseudooceanicola endophyticus]MXN18869.1 tripartite tricarboxylate transporter substrate binding protein [Pseudooceanicola albus]